MNRRDECDGVFCYKAYRLFDTGILAELLLLAEFSDRLGVQHSFGVGVLSFLGLGKQGVEKALSITCGGVVPDIISFNTVVTALQKASEWQWAAEASDDSLQVCIDKWQGAEADPLQLQELVDMEANATWPRIAAGKLNIAHSEGRRPRLVVESSVCGTNSSCRIPELTALPALHSIAASWPLRGVNELIAAFALDVKAAHKSIRVRHSERGLLGIRVGS
eukprot:s199_g8.t1